MIQPYEMSLGLPMEIYYAAHPGRQRYFGDNGKIFLTTCKNS
jgi:hypothetical protein